MVERAVVGEREWWNVSRGRELVRGCGVGQLLSVAVGIVIHCYQPLSVSVPRGIHDEALRSTARQLV